tara:strand:- start:164 stop:322 length:159 start_codon:yes stop_codon:yes gene_type:complete
MKKIAFLLVLVISNLSLISCDKDNLAETDSIYKSLSATEGDDGDVKKNPDED